MRYNPFRANPIITITNRSGSMRIRRERNMAELYDSTERLAQPEITPILEGTCHIQGPVHEYNYESPSTDLCHFPVETDCLNASNYPYPRTESGTCNVCSAPCSLCLHFNRASPVMETNLDEPSVTIPSRKDDDTCSYAAASVVKSGAQDKQENTNRKTSHSLSSSSSLYSSVENAENKETFRSSGDHNAFDLVISPKVILDAVENNNFLQEQSSSTCGSPFSSDGIKPSEINDEKASDTNDGKHREKCHIENCLHIVESKDSNSGIRDHPAEIDEKIVGCSSRSEENSNIEYEDKAFQKEVTHAYINTEIAENQTQSEGNVFLLMKNKTTSESIDVLYQNTDSLGGPNSFSNMPTKAQLTCSGSPTNASLSQSYVDDEISPTDGKLFVPSLDCENSIPLCKISKEDGAKSQLPFMSSKIADESLGTKNYDSKVESDKAAKCSESNEQPTVLKSNPQLPQVSLPLPLQPNNDLEISTETEDDVKVCDICGDAGQEELLAICSRCSDGAEHIYCMRVMLDKVPEGVWLCEECQFKETDNEVIGKSEAQFEHETIDAPSIDENSQNVESISKSLHGVENKAIASDIKPGTKEPISSISSKRRRESSEVNSASKEKNYKGSGAPSVLTIPRNLVSDESIKLDIVNAKPNSPITTSSHSDGVSQSIGFTQTTTDGQHSTCTQTSNNADLSKIQTHAEARKGPLSKSVSFNNSKVPKVKQLLENVPQKQKSPREYNLSTTRNEGLFRAITKSSSFRNDSSCFRSAETISKVQALNSPKNESPRGLKPVKDRSIIDKKNSISDHRLGSSALSATSFSSLKADSKVQQHDARVKMNSDSSNLTDCRGLHDATSLSNEVKKQPSASLSRSGATSLVRLPKNEDRKPYEPIVKAAEQKHKDEKIKDHSFSGSSRQATAVNNQLLRCYRCNESGHATQFCPVEKLSMITTMLSSERNLKDKDNRISKWKVAFEGLKDKSGKKMNVKPSDQSEEVSLSSTDANSEIASKDFASTSTNFSSVEGTEDVQDFSKATNTIHGNKKVEVPKTSLFLSRKYATLDFADDLPTKPNIQNLSDQDSILVHQLRASVIPELDYIWQGAFEVLSSAKPPSHFDGFQAHLSAYVSPNALEVAKQFPCKILLKEVPRLSSWPLQFHENSPKEDNIALFFFAKDNESYDNYYLKLLENMLTYDLALVGNIDAMELLIYHSNLLPENSRRWNKLLYLWGVFRRRQSNSLVDLPGLEKKSSVSLLEMKATMNDLPTPINLPDISDEHTHDLSKTNAPNYDICTVHKDIPTSGNVVGFLNKDGEVLNKNISCSLPAVGFSNLSDAALIPVSHGKPKLQIDIEQLPSEMEIDLAGLDNLANNSDSRRDHGHVLPSSTMHSNCENTTISVLVDCWPGNEMNFQKMKKQRTEVDLDNQLSDKFMKTDHLILEPKPTLEHAQSTSVEAIKCSSHLLQPTADTMLWADESFLTSLGEEKEHKRMRIDNGGRVGCKSREETLRSSLFSKIQPLPSSLISSSMFHEAVSRSSKNEERHFFPNDFGPTASTKANDLVHVLSSDDEDIHDSDAPNLELALGGKRRLVKQDAFPISSSKDRGENARDNLLGPAVDEGDDTLASLSLSLAFPASEKMKSAKPNSEAEQLLPDKPCISTSLLLFGGYRDT